jgi:H+-transporting ATPase
MWNPLSWVTCVVILVAVAVSDGEHHPPLPGFAAALGAFLLLISSIAFYKERGGAGNGAMAFMHTPAPKAKVKRDGSWIEIESGMLVPGDMISFKLGDITPADCYLTKAINLSIDLAALTGDSLPASKNVGDTCLL